MAPPVNISAGCDADMLAMSQDQLELEVCWMSSGETACYLRPCSNLRAAEIKAQVHQHAGIPMEEQRLFLSNGKELAGEVELFIAAEEAESGHTSKLCAVRDGSEALLLVRSISDPRITDLGTFRSPQNFPALPDGNFNSVHKLSTGICGDIFLYDWKHGERTEAVAVKILDNDLLARVWGTETDERTIHTYCRGKAPPTEDALTEIGILTHLSNQNDLPESLLKMYGVFAKDNFTWLVTEFCEGGELFDVVANGIVTETQLHCYSRDLLEAVSYLHRHHIGHRDISLENILLKGGAVKLMDFGMAVRSHSSSGTALRYFRAVGKDFYRAPECYVPMAATVSVTVPDQAKGNDLIFAETTVRGDRYLCEVRLPLNALPSETRCEAEVWGYSAAPADIWAVGICMFILGFQCPPWNWAMLDDQSFAYMRSVRESSDGSGLEALLKTWGKTLLCKEAMQLLNDMLTVQPTLRPSASECLRSAFFHGLTDSRFAKAGA